LRGDKHTTKIIVHNKLIWQIKRPEQFWSAASYTNINIVYKKLLNVKYVVYVVQLNMCVKSNKKTNLCLPKTTVT
jgi:hypothetical protein